MLSLRSTCGPSLNASRQQLLRGSCARRQLGSSASRPAANRASQASASSVHAQPDSVAIGARLGWPIAGSNSVRRRSVRVAAWPPAAKDSGSEVRLEVLMNTYSSTRFSLTTSELLKYPDSLLSVKGLASMRSSTFYFEMYDLVNTGRELFDVILNLYRDDAFPIEFLEKQLADCSRDANMWPALDALHSKLEDLLSFLKLPGRVVDWIPWQTCTVCHPKVLELTPACLAKDAVKLMMSHTPLSRPLGVLSGGTASFVVVADADKPASLYTLRTPPTHQRCRSCCMS